MQVEIDQVVSRVRPVSGESMLAPETLRSIIAAVMEAMDQRQQQRDYRNEELSLQNYQQRNQPWNR